MPTTPNIALNKPAYRDARWDIPLNANADILDGLHGKITNKLNTLVTSANIVDVFIYNTAKDTDGGAWTGAAITQSWYTETLNTATRGSKREFPKVALIVAETTKVTIYDATETGCPMWMVFQVGSGYWTTGNMGFVDSGAYPISVACLNGVLCIGSSIISTIGVEAISFLADSSFRYNVSSSYGGTYNGNIAERTAAKGWANSIPANKLIVNGLVNDVAMTTISRTENAYGLLDPVIAVATDGGVSVIDGPAGVGTVVDLTYVAGLNAISTLVKFTQANGILWVTRPDTVYGVYLLWETTIPSADKSTAPFKVYYKKNAGLTTEFPQYDGGSGITALTPSAVGTSTAVTLISEDTTTPANGMVSYITNSYNTGWLKGDIRRAVICEAEGTTETLVNLVTNGTFTTDTVWTKGAAWTINVGTGVATKAAGSSNGISQPILTVGKRYSITFTVTSWSAGNFYAQAGSAISSGFSGTGTFTAIVTCTVSTGLAITGDTATAGSIDNVICTEVIEDRSVKASALTVNGSLTRSPVATGAELQAISGFSGSNYLSQAYSADLDFGTGDFYIAGWLKVAPNSNTENIFQRFYLPSGFSGSYMQVAVLATGTLTLKISDDALSTFDAITTTAVVDTSSWRFFVAQRVSTKLEVWLEASKAATDVTITAATGSLSNANAISWIGYDSEFTSIALLRIGSGSLSAAQIAKMYADESPLFQGNAKCTIQGASSAVTALAYDDAKDLLHVGTSAQVTSFTGLKVYNESQAFSGSIKALSAYNDNMLVATTTAASAFLALINLRAYLEAIYGFLDKLNIGPKRLGGGSSYSEFESDGHLKFEGNATTWEDENFDPTMLTGTGTLPASITFASTTTHVASFAGNANDEVEGIKEYPHKAKLNAVGQTTVKLSFHAHCYPTTTSGGNVRLALEYFFTKENVAITTSTTIYVTGAVGTTAWAKKTFTFADIAAPDELGSQLHFRFARLSNDALDTYADALAISTIGFHYEADSTGSRQTLVK